MRKFFMLAVAVVVTAMGYGQVVRGTIGEGNYTLSDGTTIPRYGLDFDNDSNLEFVVSAYFDMNTYETYANAHLEYRLDLFNNVITVSDEDYTSIKLLNPGATVGASCSFLGEGEAMFSDFEAISESASYAGFMMTFGDNVHYGYARFHIIGDSVSWDAIYYNQSVGQAITVGDGDDPSLVDECEGGRFVVAACDGLRINVVQERDEEVKVYDMSGRLVGVSRGENVMIDLHVAGVYIVKSGRGVAKIGVK